MRIVVCLKEVPDPDAVNSYAVAGRLTIGDDGRTLTQSSIARLANAYDEQALEAALRLRDAGTDCTITAVSVAGDASTVLRRAAALGADQAVVIRPEAPDLDCAVAAALLSAYIRQSGGADLVLCGRQASDDDQGVVPGLIGEALGMPIVTVARAIELDDAPDTARVTRVTPEGDEVIEVTLPALVTVSNELGQPRYPTAARSMAARKLQPETVTVDSLGLSEAELRPRVVLERMFVPVAHGDCEFLTGESAAGVASQLVARLRADSLI